ncbi:FKBP-type peptidyl-prolyl cis-trans isomerase [Actinoallomurus bryophytorum]|uniref:peptidylprolyl isomerase n=1 Tax=Actinoallomurus bryophytorum TaxID=1490222 RepID=A0A543CWM1_9ACTN|nr:FKBP-type peptidyl-prolyl cis-trans isomerase [Actinoallomurus bryophytorum]TQM01506.1 peptidylprolyl isomerase [Actinoallomurus bryophytorum]
MSEVEGREDAETEETQEDARPKVKMPQAKDIRRSDFTPHALNAKGRPAPRSGTRKAAKRRNIIYSAVAVVAVVAVVGVSVWYANRPAPSVKVKGAFGKAPVVTVPKSKPAAKQQVKELIHGKGPKVGASDFVVAHLVGYQWSAKGGKELLNTFKKGAPATGTASQLTGLAPLDKAIAGRTQGTRLELTLPYAAVGDQVAQALQLARTDDFVVAVDVVNSFGKSASVQGTQQKIDAKLPQVTPGAAGQAPTVKIPSGKAPDTLQVKTLIQGTGKAVTKGQTLVGQYDGVLWRTGKEFDSSYKHGAPAGFPIGVGQVIPAWDKALVGQKIGSRVLLVVPPKEGYGPKGSPDAGIKGTDTLVFVVDVLGAF